MNEASYTNRLRRLLEAEGAFPIKFRPGGGQRAGTPDLYVAHPDWHGWIEFKYGRYKVSAVQRSVFERLAWSRVPVVVLRGPHGIVESFDGIELASIDIKNPLIPQLASLPSCATIGCAD